MFLKYLFAQYDDRRGPIFASRLMTRLGLLFMGSPDQKGLGHIRQDLKDSYYQTADDRRLPLDPAALEEWQRHSILLSEYRQLEHPEIARASFFAVCAASLVLVAAASPFNGSLQRTLEIDRSGKVSQWFSNAFSSTESEAGAPSASECQAIQRSMMSGGSKLGSDEALQERWDACVELMNRENAGGAK